MSVTDQCPRCGGDCPMLDCPECGGCENTGVQPCPCRTAPGPDDVCPDCGRHVCTGEDCEPEDAEWVWVGDGTAWAGED